MIPIPQTVVKDGYSPELPAGFELMNYKIERKLGAGGFSMTYLATERLSGREVVIKENFPFECTHRNTTTLRVGPAGAERKELFEWALKRFVDEARVLIKLNHPNIVPVLNVFEAMGTAYYVMPLVSGAVLDVAAPAPGKIDEAWLSPLLQKLLTTLDYLHGGGMMHRDIKPTNIILREDGSPILIDFGASRSSDATHTFTRVGTSGYSPAEQFMAHGMNGPWSDLYSLGATCYRLITGNEPQDAVERLVEDQLPLLAESADLKKRFSVKFLAAIDKSMRMPRYDRWQSAREWLNELREATEPQQIVVDAPSAQKNNVVGGQNNLSAQGRTFSIGWAVCFGLVAAVCSLVGGAILLGIVAAIRGAIRGEKVGKIWRYVLVDVGCVVGMWAFATISFIVIAELSESFFWIYSLPGAVSLAGFAAFYQYMMGARGDKIALVAFLCGIGGAILGYVYTEILLDFYAALVQNEEAVIRFMGAICMSLIAAAVCALVGGFGKKN